jgi:hypothetical protein
MQPKAPPATEAASVFGTVQPLVFNKGFEVPRVCCPEGCACPEHALVFKKVEPFPKDLPLGTRGSELPTFSVRWVDNNVGGEMNVDVNGPFEEQFGFSLEYVLQEMNGRPMPSCPLIFLQRFLVCSVFVCCMHYLSVYLSSCYKSGLILRVFMGEENQKIIFTKIFMPLFCGGKKASTVASVTTKVFHPLACLSTLLLLKCCIHFSRLAPFSRQ